MEFRFDYSTFFWLLPLDVHKLIPLYMGMVRKDFAYSKTLKMTCAGELRTTKSGSVVYRPITQLRHRTYKPNGAMLGINKYGGLCEYKHDKWQHSGESCNCDAFCVTPDNGCVVCKQNRMIVKYDAAWVKQCETNAWCAYEWFNMKLTAQSNGNIVALYNAKSELCRCFLYSAHLRIENFVTLADSATDRGYTWINLAVDCFNQILMKTTHQFYLYSSDLTQLLTTYTWHTQWIDMQIDNRGHIFLLEHEPQSNKITEFC